MKLITLAFITLVAYGQATTGQICWTPDKLTPAKTVCRDVPPQVKASARDYVAAQNAAEPDKYSGIGDLIFTAVAAVLDVAVDQFPPRSIVKDRTDADALKAAEEAKRRALLERTKAVEPK